MGVERDAGPSATGRHGAVAPPLPTLSTDSIYCAHQSPSLSNYLLIIKTKQMQRENRSTLLLLSFFMEPQKSKNYSTRYSRVVPHHSTDRAITSLTSQIGRDAVCSGVYGRSCSVHSSLQLSTVSPLDRCETNTCCKERVRAGCFLINLAELEAMERSGDKTMIN